MLGRLVYMDATRQFQPTLPGASAVGQPLRIVPKAVEAAPAAPKVAHPVDAMPGRGTLPMYLTANELQRDYTPGDANGESSAEVYSRKLGESRETGMGHGAGLFDSISQKGFDDAHPIVVNPRSAVLHDGHHRVAAMGSINPDRPLPINWHESTWGKSPVDTGVRWNSAPAPLASAPVPPAANTAGTVSRFRGLFKR